MNLLQLFPTKAASMASLACGITAADGAAALGLSGPPNGVSRANPSTADDSCWVRPLVELGASCASSSATMLRSAVARTRSGVLAALAETVAPLLRAMRAPLLFGASSCGRRRRTMVDLRWHSKEEGGGPARGLSAT